MDNERHISQRDSFSYLLLVEEGLFLRRLMHQHKNYPRSSATLALIALPFIAVIEHDAIPFVNKTFGVNLPREDPKLSQMRHLTKSLDSKYLDYHEYSEQAKVIMQQLKSHFKHYRGPLASLLNSLTTDVGVSYYQGVPIYATYTVVHYLTTNNSALLDSDNGTYSEGLGYEAGKAGTFLYALAGKQIDDDALFMAPEFLTDANDFDSNKMMNPIASHGIDDRVAFFFLSELMMQLASVEALHSGGFFDDPLWMKFATASLYHAYKAIGVFSGYAHDPSCNRSYPSDFLDEVSALFNREERKMLKRVRPLRNALVHYDFGPVLVPDVSDKMTPHEVLGESIGTSLGITVDEYYAFLTAMCSKLIKEISDLIKFPAYDTKRDPYLTARRLLR